MDSACFNYSIKVITIQDSFAPHCCHCSSVTQSCLNLCNPMECSTPGLPVPPTSGSLPKFMSIASVMPSSHLILCHPSLLLPSIFPSIKDFSKESSVCIRWAKYWSFSFSISPSNEYSWLISLQINWFNLLASKWLSGVFSSTTVQRHQFFAALPSFPFLVMNQSAVPYRVLTVVWGSRSLMGTRAPSWELML